MKEPQTSDQLADATLTEIQKAVERKRCSLSHALAQAFLAGARYEQALAEEEELEVEQAERARRAAKAAE